VRDLFTPKIRPKGCRPPWKSQFCRRFCLPFCILQLITENAWEPAQHFLLNHAKKLEKLPKSGTLGGQKGINMFD